MLGFQGPSETSNTTLMLSSNQVFMMSHYYISIYIYDAVKQLNDHTFLPGGENQVGDLVHKPPRNGPTLWEIGIPDRTAAEFYVPDPDPQLINKLYTNSKQK